MAGQNNEAWRRYHLEKQSSKYFPNGFFDFGLQDNLLDGFPTDQTVSSIVHEFKVECGQIIEFVFLRPELILAKFLGQRAKFFS